MPSIGVVPYFLVQCTSHKELKQSHPKQDSKKFGSRRPTNVSASYIVLSLLKKINELSLSFSFFFSDCVLIYAYILTSTLFP